MIPSARGNPWMNASADTPVPAHAGPSSAGLLKPCLIAVGGILLAWGIRLALDPWLHELFPFAPFLLATILIAWHGGFIPSLVSLVLGCVLAEWSFIEPRHSFAILWDASHAGKPLTYLLVGSAVVFFGRSMHLARQKADASAYEAIQKQKQLEQEVTERRRAEAEVRRLNSELEQRVLARTAELRASNKELEAFTYSVSHDLRAPLRHVDGFAQILETEFRGQLPAGAAEQVAKIRQGSQHMGRLVDDLLDLARVGKKELERQPVDLREMAQSIVSEIQPGLNGRVVEWQVGPLPRVSCDPGLVRLVLTNLLDNAAKYTRPRNPARIEIRHENQNGETVFMVRDNGVGFNMKYVAKLFGVFQRLHSAEEFEGTGVGLATVARIIQKFGGRIWAEAAVDQGATFFFTLEPPPKPAAPAS
jgi:signal transduction histidine kinase